MESSWKSVHDNLAERNNNYIFFDAESGLCQEYNPFEDMINGIYSSNDNDDFSYLIHLASTITGGDQFNTSSYYYWLASSLIAMSKATSSFNSSLTRSMQILCEPGYFCQLGIRYPCPSGRYGSLTGESNHMCEGSCYRGYYCYERSISPYSISCGSADLICPEGSGSPIIVPIGYYSNENVSELNRYVSFPCTEGYFCPGDGKRYPCPAGKYRNNDDNYYRSECMPCNSGKYLYIDFVSSM